MASQTFIVATIAGESAAAVRELFAGWETAAKKDSDEANPALDAFCDVLRDHRKELPIVYYCEWIDRWLMGDDLSGGTWLCGHRFWACCITGDQASVLAARPKQNQAQAWLSARLLEAGAAWKPLVGDTVIVVAREVFAGSTLDEEGETALGTVPQWLSSNMQ